MEKILVFLKFLFEKHLIVSLLSFIFYVPFVSMYPSIPIITDSIPTITYHIFIYILIFLTLLLVEHLLNYTKSNIQERRNSYYLQEKEKELFFDRLDRLWSFVDGLSIDDREILMYFIQSNNSPYENQFESFYDSILNNRNIMSSTTVKVQHKKDELTNPGIEEGMNRFMQSNPLNFVEVKRYKLKDDFFSLLKYSYDVYNRISHFEDEGVE
jgi:hypothetical protein